MQNRLYFSREVRDHFDALLPHLDAVFADAPPQERRAFELRFERYFSNLYESVVGPYGWHENFEDFLVRLTKLMAQSHLRRPEVLRDLDFERELTPDWFQRQQIIGYACYVERFAGTLQGVREKLDYLSELGVGYIHLQGVLEPREGPSDGGYAIIDYRNVHSEIGSMEDLEKLSADLRSRGISVCVDLVLNHCAKEHDWARKAMEGDETFQGYFYMYPDREMPDEFEANLPEIFPEFAPGNFTWYDEMQRWVWTTFNEYQWDLNWTNPEIFLEMVDIMYDLANRGVEVFRLDAVAFMWKRVGTDCQNQPEVHDLLQALRACANIVTPSVVHKAEAIVSPNDLVHYLGTGKRYGKVSNIAYHNTLMVQYWAALASRDTRLMVHTLREFPRTPTSIAWGTYIRCHDDIGWAVTDEDAGAMDMSGHGHRIFLSNFYTGEFAGSHARGKAFQTNERTGDRRVSGSLASLNGLEVGLELNDARLISLSVERSLLGFALMCGWGGIPLIFMGDEIGLLNDYEFGRDPELANDNRWLHRPYMDWDKASRRHVAGFVEARMFEGVSHIIRARKRTPHLHAMYENFVPESVNPHVFLHVRPHPLGNFLGVYNFSEEAQLIDLDALSSYQISQPHPYDQIEQRHIIVEAGRLRIPPYGRLWLI
ncbi:MAG: alpha-amylase family protein [Myxococcota bacterium]